MISTIIFATSLILGLPVILYLMWSIHHANKVGDLRLDIFKWIDASPDVETRVDRFMWEQSLPDFRSQLESKPWVNAESLIPNSPMKTEYLTWRNAQ